MLSFSCFQEIALYGEFSIKETMMYFGWIFGMETPEIDDRLQFLLNFLDLPSQSRLVKNLRWAEFLRGGTFSYKEALFIVGNNSR